MRIAEDIVCIVLILFLPSVVIRLLHLDTSMNEIRKERER